MKNLRSTIILGVLTLGSLFTACDNFDKDVPPARMSQVIVNDDTFTTKKNQGVQLDVLANDSIGGQATLQFSPPAHGTIQTNSNGTVFYQPDLDFIGNDNFNYKACIGNDCATALITIQVKNDSINTCTVKANDDFRSIDASYYPYKIMQVLMNDNLCGIDTLATNVKITNGPAHGQAYVTSLNKIYYTPANNYFGPDVITYTISNSKGLSTAKIYIDLVCWTIPNPDVANVVRHLGTFSDSVSINLLKNDKICPNKAPVTLSVVGPLIGNYGTFMVAPNGRVIYTTSYPGKNVSDHLTYRICQGNDCSNSGLTVYIK